MSTNSNLAVKDLNIDLKNFRTVPQKKESDAIKTMIAISNRKFYAIMESIIEDGYLPTENIIILKDGSKNIVKEGNRRIAALKLILGYENSRNYDLPASILESIDGLTSTWKKENSKIPCLVFDVSEEEKAEKVVSRTHGYGERAGRDPWNSVAKARHNRDVNSVSEPGLDLLEKYLKNGSNLTKQQKDRWGGDYPMTVLTEALRKICPRFNFSTSADLAKKYPKINYLAQLEEIIRAIGLELITFKSIRESDVATTYGVPLPVATPPPSTSPNPSAPPSSGPGSSNPTGSPTGSAGQGKGGSNAPSSPNANPTPHPPAPPTASINDPKHVMSVMKRFSPKGNNRQKVVLLRDEITKLKIQDNPIAFCFLLRSMFEISAKAYCLDNSIAIQKNGNDKKLVDLLKECSRHVTSNNTNTAMVKVLHGALTEMAQPDRILSVTSMNQLVHNPSFSVVPSDVCTLFSNIYPLLESIN